MQHFNLENFKLKKKIKSKIMFSNYVDFSLGFGLKEWEKEPLFVKLLMLWNSIEMFWKYYSAIFLHSQRK